MKWPKLPWSRSDRGERYLSDLQPWIDNEAEAQRAPSPGQVPAHVTERLIRLGEAPGSLIPYSAAWNSSGSLIAVGCRGAARIDLRQVTVATLQPTDDGAFSTVPISVAPFRIFSFDWRPNTDWLAGAESVVGLWEARSGRLVETDHAVAAVSPRFNWSPDGQLLSVSNDGVGGGDGTIYRVPIDPTSGLIEVIGHFSSSQGIAWAPTSDRFAYIAGDAEQQELVVSSLFDVQQVNLGLPGSNWKTPCWLPGGQILALGHAMN